MTRTCLIPTVACITCIFNVQCTSSVHLSCTYQDRATLGLQPLAERGDLGGTTQVRDEELVTSWKQAWYKRCSAQQIPQQRLVQNLILQENNSLSIVPWIHHLQLPAWNFIFRAASFHSFSATQSWHLHRTFTSSKIVFHKKQVRLYI